MFRGLKEDGSCLPVAFLDAQCYMTSLKSLGDSGLWLAADAWKGVWFCGFSVCLLPLFPFSLSAPIPNLKPLKQQRRG